MKPVVEVTSLKKRFYRPVEIEILHGVNLTAHEGETVAIMGASGEGKSTLLQILGLLERPTAGSIALHGQPVRWSEAPKLRNQSLGFIFQSFYLLEDYTALENILMPSRIGRKATRRGSSKYDRAQGLLELVGLQNREHFPSKLLSGGEKQRIAIARALINDPQILLADEPSGNLDADNSNAIHQLLLQAVKESGKTLITVTHDKALADLCDTVYRLRGGVLEPYSG